MRIDIKKFPAAKAYMNAYVRGKLEYCDELTRCAVRATFGVNSTVLPMKYSGWK
jgi:hypothetical protein